MCSWKLKNQCGLSHVRFVCDVKSQSPGIDCSGIDSLSLVRDVEFPN